MTSNGNQAILEFLETAERLDTLTSKERMAFIARGLALSVKIASANAEEATELKKKVYDLEKYSWGLWAARHPKAAVAFFLVVYSFAISDIRKPFLAWLTEMLAKYLFT